MRIGIYIDNSAFREVNCSELSSGNPGIGGTEYSILLLTQEYKKAYPKSELYLFVSSESILPKVDKIVMVNNFNNLPYYSDKYKVNVLVVSAVYKGQPLGDQFFKLMDKSTINVIVWGHNYYLNDFCNRLTRHKCVKANVFVGRQQYDRYIDHAIIHKSTYIYNMYPTVKTELRKNNDGKTVTYIGSIIPTKGFHLLANAWKDILKVIPNAQLHVIGSGKLYDRNSKLGVHGIAEASYEESFIKGITDVNGKLLPSICFHGVMGEEKKNVIASTSVGVVNPSGRTETFGISALDFSSRGVPVVTIASGGFFDTVKHEETGLLYTNVKDLVNYIVRLLKERELNITYGEHGRSFIKKFAPCIIVKEWNELFEKVMSERELPIRMPCSFRNSNLKSFRVANRRIKQKIHIEYPLSVIAIESFLRNVLRRLGK